MRGAQLILTRPITAWFLWAYVFNSRDVWMRLPGFHSRGAIRFLGLTTATAVT